MATTWPKLPLRLFVISNSFLSLVEEPVPEGASQTFVTHSPLKIVSGLAVEWTSGTDIAYWSAGSGQNGTGKTAMCYPALPNIGIEANFLGSAAADNTLAAADLGTSFDLVKGTNLLGASGGDAWYISDTTSSVMVKIYQFKCEVLPPNLDPSTRPAVDDINARVRALPLIANLHWDA